MNNLIYDMRDFYFYLQNLKNEYGIEIEKITIEEDMMHVYITPETFHFFSGMYKEELRNCITIAYDNGDKLYEWSRFLTFHCYPFF